MRLDLVGRGAMVAVIPALVVLILITPNLMGRPAVLSAIPILIIGMTESNVLIDVDGAVDHYRYRTIQLQLLGLDNMSFQENRTATESYGLDFVFSRNVTSVFDISVLVANQDGNTFALNATVFTGEDEIGEYIAVSRRDVFRTDVVYLPADFRTFIPVGRTE